jgi:pimeloyl-ACP methyl ester carboxylesterase
MASLQAVLAGLSAMEAWSGVHRLPHIKQPSLIIWGDADATYTWHQTEQLWQQIQSSQLAVLPHCGHAAHLEKPTLFNAMVSDFLQS